MRQRVLASGLVVAIFCGCDEPCAAQCPEYQVDVVSLPYCGLPGYGIGPGGLSSDGRVTGGYATCAEETGPFYWNNGTLTLFELDPKSVGGGLDVNSKQQIVGIKDGPTGHVGFLHEDGKATDITVPGSNFVEAYAINESSIAVGMYNGNRAFMWQDGVATPIVPSIGPSAVANDINNSNQIVGWMGVAPFPPFYGEAFMWDNGKTIALGFPQQATNSEANAVSNNGHVCGVYTYPNPEGGPVIRRPCHWKNGILTEIELLRGFIRGHALDVNDQGTVVGYFSGGLPTRAFIWRSGITTDLNDMIAPELELTLSQGVAINDNGQILCSGLDETNSFIAVLLSPIPSPIGDSNCNGSVDVDDLLKVINTWGDETPKGSTAMPPADFSHNHIVDVDDLLIVINNWTF